MFAALAAAMKRGNNARIKLDVFMARERETGCHAESLGGVSWIYAVYCRGVSTCTVVR